MDVNYDNINGGEFYDNGNNNKQVTTPRSTQGLLVEMETGQITQTFDQDVDDDEGLYNNPVQTKGGNVDSQTLLDEEDELLYAKPHIRTHGELKKTLQ
eukprot:788115_1